MGGNIWQPLTAVQECRRATATTFWFGETRRTDRPGGGNNREGDVSVLGVGEGNRFRDASTTTQRSEARPRWLCGEQTDGAGRGGSGWVWEHLRCCS